MRHLLVLLFLLCCSPGIWADPVFQPADHTFQVSLPGKVHSVEQGEGRFFWGSDDGIRSFYFGYTVLPRAANMAEEDLRAGLGQLLTGYLGTASVREKHRESITVQGHPGLDANGSGSYGASWVRIVAVGPRIYLLASDGTSDKENQGYVESFKATIP